MVLDVKDRRILYYLSIDSGISRSQLAKKVALSQSSVKYRIARFRQLGIIKRFACIINLGALNLTTFNLLIRSKDMKSQDYLRKALISHKYATSVMVLSGKWDFFVELVAKDFIHFSEMIKSLITQYSEEIMGYSTFISRDTLRVEHIPPTIYEGLNLKEQLPQRKKKKQIQIDNIDRNLLFELNKDSSLTFVELAEKINSSVDVVRYRIKQLKENNILIKCFAEISVRELGYTQ